MTILATPNHEVFAQGLARGLCAAAAYVEAGYKENRHNAATLARKQHILARVGELQEEQLAIHQQIHCLGTGCFGFSNQAFDDGPVGSNDTVVLPVMSDFTPRNLLLMSRMWLIVLAANLAGTLFAAIFSTFTPVLTNY